MWWKSFLVLLWVESKYYPKSSENLYVFHGSYTVLKHLWIITIMKQLKTNLWFIVVVKFQGQAYLLSSEAAANDSVEMVKAAKK